MPDAADRERAIAAYAAEVRAFHAFFGAVLLAMAGFHLAVLLPFYQARAAAPLMAGALARVRVEAAAAEAAEKAAKAAAAALGEFRRALETEPAELRRSIAELVARGRAAAGADGDPYKATIRVPGEGGRQGEGAPGEEPAPVEEAIRRLIGRKVEALSLALDAVMEPLRALGNPPREITEALRTAEETLVRGVLALNEALREAFAADPGFWHRWDGPGATLGAASTRTEEIAREIEEARRALDRRLALIAAAMKTRQHALQGRAGALSARQRDLADRVAAFAAGPQWMPLRYDEAARLYPVLAGSLALMVLFRLRRLLTLRRAHEGTDLDLMAPSWVVGPRGAPGRWWALVLVCLPLVATIHAATAALGDPGLFVSLLGEPSPTSMMVFAGLYGVLVLAGIAQLPQVTRGLVGGPVRRPQGKGGRGGGG